MTCSTCGEFKPEEEFRWRIKAKGVRHKRCKSCMRAYEADWYVSNNKRRDSIRANNDKYLEEKFEYARSALATGCVDCGNTDLRVLEFDHVRGEKIDGVLRVVARGYGWDVIKAEIAKCEVRCKNCHAIQTYERAGWTWASA